MLAPTVPNKLADHKRRVSFAEDVQVLDAMRRIAEKEGKTLTGIYAEATRTYLQQKHQPQRGKSAPARRAPPKKYPRASTPGQKR